MKGLKRAVAGLLLVLAAGTATSGATYTASSDNTQPFGAAADFGVHVSVNDPNPPLRGTETIGATATETNGGTIATVVIQRSPAGAGPWTTICTDGDGAPFTCSLDTTTLSNGLYDFRATATNNNGYSRTSAVRANQLVDNAAPTVTMDAPAAWVSGTISLTSANGDTGGSGLATVRYEYKTSSGGSWATACTGSSPGYSCPFDTTAMTAGTSYDFRAIATDGAGNQTTSALVTNRRADQAPPSGSITDPGAANLRGTVTLNGTASDGLSGVQSLRMEYAPAGTSTWSQACVDTTAPFTQCGWDTTAVANAFYDLRAVVTDLAGNTYTTGSVVNKRVDNQLPTVSLTVTPTAGALTGLITLEADATDNVGVAEVALQYSVAGAGAWANACATFTAPPYECTANSAGVPDGLYDLRALATDVSGNTNTSIDANRRIENFAPSGSDVQTANGGATPGVIQTGDSITLTYSESMDPASIVAGWNGTGSQNVHVRFTHAGAGDRVLFYNAANTATIPLGGGTGVDLKADYVPNANATYTATLTQSANGASFTVVLATRIAGNVNGTAPAASTMAWTPAAGARDLAAKACTTTVRNETGAADVEF